MKGAGFRKKLSFGKISPRGKTEFSCVVNKMDGKRMRIDDLECSMFESLAKRSRPSPFVLSQAVPKRFLKAYTHVPDEKMGTVSFFARIFPALLALLTGELCFQQYKATLVLRVEMTKGDGKRKVQQPYFSSKPFVILRPEDIDEAIEEGHRNIDTQMDKWTREVSGWTVNKVLCLYVNIAKYQPLKGSSYIELPKYLQTKKAIVNVRNNDNKCLEWALLSSLYPAHDNPHRVSKYKDHEKELNFAGIEFPVTLKDIPKVERLNNLAINVFGYSESAGVHPLYLTNDLSQDPITLLLITEIQDGKTKSHYCWIKDFNRLCFDQTKHKERKHFCLRCISPHSSERTPADHMIYCRGVDTAPCHAVFPQASEDGSPPTIQFKNIQHLMKAPFVIYADTESIIQPTTTPNTDSNTVQSTEHIPCSFAYVVVRSDGQVISERLYRGEDAMDVLFEKLNAELERIRSDLKDIKEIDMTPEEQEAHNNADKCWICNGEFRPYASGDSGGMWKVRDHDHITGKKSPTPLAFQCFPLASPCTWCSLSDNLLCVCCCAGQYRGAAHSKCNQQLRIDPYRTPIPVFFHNLKNYDSHHLISAIGRTEEKTTAVTDKNGQAIIGKDKPVTVTDGSISAIVQNMEKLISFSWGQFRFIDSFAFLNSSLDKLVKNTPKASLSITRSYIEQAKFNIITRKGVFPYEYMDSFDRFEETQLPPKENFYSSLSDEGITDDDYKHAQEVWDTFNCATLGDYHDIYLQTDVLLLADVFENFRKTAMVTYGLDPAHYYTLPGYSWDALLKCTNIELDQITEANMYLFVEKGLRGGISMVSHCHAQANNQYMENYNNEEPTSFIQYLDANNLYGWAMSQPMPTGGFEWVNYTDQILETPANADHGFILEVDLAYPPALHADHNDYPLAPEKLTITKDQMSPYQQKLIDELGVSISCEKLVPNLMDKSRYVLHYRNLQLYLSLGMKITKVHKVLQFNQSPWMQPYIMKNTQLRTTATNDFEKDFYKLMNNAVSHFSVSLFSLFQISANFVKCPACLLLDWVSFFCSGVRKNFRECEETRQCSAVQI